ncbi:MAG: signal peptide peptidase SppA [Bryobacteraceae bacterium]
MFAVGQRAERDRITGLSGVTGSSRRPRHLAPGQHVQMEMEHIGKYKDAGDMFTRTSMSPETRQVMDSVLDSIYSDILTTVSGGRKKTVEEIRAAIDSGPILAPEALKRGLVDANIYEDQVYGELKNKVGVEGKRVSAKDYLKAMPAVTSGSRIAVVIGQGAIYRGEGQDLNEDGIYSDSFVRTVRQAANDTSIKAAIVRIDSPGGDAIASDDILREVKLLSQKKPTVISMSDVAASGGYYMAMTGDPIIAYPNTLTGSIGVIYGKANVKGLYDKLGITKDILKRGANADIDSDYTPLTDASRKKLRDSMEHIYTGFVTRVASARRQKYEQIDELAQGRVWLGSQAKDNKLVDELGGLDRAIEVVKAKAKIPAGEQVRLVPFPGRKSFFEALMKGSASSLVEAKIARISGQYPLSSVFPAGVMAQLKMLVHGGILRTMPYTIEVR